MPTGFLRRVITASSWVVFAAVLACTSESPTHSPSDASSGGLDAQGGASGAGPAQPDGAGGSAPKDATVDAPPSGALPDLLSETGLFSRVSPETLAPGVRPFRPRFELWSDGAEKRRFLFLPAGTTIDSAEPDAWIFPVGTKVWKEFTRDGIRVETRLFQKTREGQDGWQFVAYVWNAEQTDAVSAPDGLRDAGGTLHDVPTQEDCFACHSGSADMLLGVSALQLAHDTTALDQAARDALGVTLEDLVAREALSVAPAAVHFPLPGGGLDQAALGVLHVNCGHCHRPGTLAWERAELDLHLLTVQLGFLGETGAFRTAVGVPTERIFDGVAARITPSDPAASAVYVRMNTRQEILAMPPIATEDVDLQGAQTLFDWIWAMPEVGQDAGASDAGPTSDAGP